MTNLVEELKNNRFLCWIVTGYRNLRKEDEIILLEMKDVGVELTKQLK